MPSYLVGAGEGDEAGSGEADGVDDRGEPGAEVGVGFDEGIVVKPVRGHVFE
jgi:hypothetical protein